MAEIKTNVMRLLSQKKIAYTPHSYPHGEQAVDGLTAAGLIGMDPQQVFKTLVTRGASKTIYVFVIPVAAELDLKKAAKAVGEKSVAMIHVSELFGFTGYVRGGCSPLGMKKHYTTVFHESAVCQQSIAVSAGKIGFQVELDPKELIAACQARTAELIVEEL